MVSGHLDQFGYCSASQFHNAYIQGDGTWHVWCQVWNLWWSLHPAGPLAFGCHRWQSLLHFPQRWPNCSDLQVRWYLAPRTDYNAWSRPIGYPYGITFGPSFIQIGLFRLGMVDKEHFSIAHKYGYVSQIFRSDGTLHPGPRSDYDLWKVRSSGPASGITYGDRFLQIGKFRIGDADGWHMLITHVDGQTIQIYRGDGTLHPGPRTDWTHALQGRYPKWHCGNIQQLCSDLSALGPDFTCWRRSSEFFLSPMPFTIILFQAPFYRTAEVK